MRYKIIRTDNKPYSIECNDEEELYIQVQNLYTLSLAEEGLDIKVFDENDNDITESPFIDEMVNEIMDGAL